MSCRYTATDFDCMGDSAVCCRAEASTPNDRGGVEGYIPELRLKECANAKIGNNIRM